MSLEALSTELQQNILGYLDFISLLKTRNTSTTWRDRVNVALSKPNIILPARAKLLQLYLDLNQHPSIFKTAVDEDEVPGDPISSEEYLSGLRAHIAQYAPKLNLRIPAEFECWMLEWPPWAPLSFAWYRWNYGYEWDCGLGCLEPKRLAYASMEEDADVVGLLIGNHGCQTWTILFFGAGKENDGMVWMGEYDELDEVEDWDVDEDEYLAASWTDWLRNDEGLGGYKWRRFP